MADREGRSNIWAFIFYPESMPDNFEHIISDFHIPCCLSPLHDADLNGNMEEKKAHYHLLLNFGAGKKKSKEQVYELSQKLNGTMPIAIDSERGMIRYFIHVDNPEKHQYDIADIKDFSGYDSSPYFKPSASLANSIMNEIKQFVIDNNITEFKDLQIYALQFPDSWGYVLNMYNCLSIYKLIDSQRNYRRIGVMSGDMAHDEKQNS